MNRAGWGGKDGGGGGGGDSGGADGRGRCSLRMTPLGYLTR